MKIQGVEKKILGLSILLGLVAVFNNCGRNDAVAPGGAPAPLPQVQVPAPQCSGGQYYLRGQCTAAPTFAEACNLRGGVWMLISGRELCQWETSYVWATVIRPSFPLLNPSDPTAPLAMNTNVRLEPGDQLVYSFSGSWGVRTADVYSRLNWGIFSFYSFNWNLDCDEISLDGMKEGSPAIYQGMLAGLLGSDGSEVFLLGSHGTKLVQRPGVLKIGINAPLFETTGACYRLSIRDLRTLHCEDAIGSHVACPTPRI